jgi:predicted ArsR family transcriptional regulator
MPDDIAAPDAIAARAGIGAVAALADPVRRAAYQAVVAGEGPVGRDEVAEALRIGRTLAAFHLDKLVDAGLLEVTYARRSGRSGPGAGRPAKLYRRSAAEHEVSLPPRQYRGAAELLAEAVERAGADATLYAVAREHGRDVGAAGEQLFAALEKLGYEPALDGSTVRLRNCPFHQLAEQFPPLVCGMNLALLEGLAAERAPGCKVRMDRGPTGCCVVLDF